MSVASQRHIDLLWPPRLIPTRCNLCGADDFDVVANITADHEYVGVLDDALALRSFRMVRCRHCQLTYLNPRPDDTHIHDYYPPEYGCFAQCPPKGRWMRWLYAILVRLKRREWLGRLPPNGVLLDFGCGNGHWLRALAPFLSEGQRLIGIDPNSAAVEQVRRHGIEAYVGDDEAIRQILPPESVDLVLLNHVIEHVPDPRRLLARLWEVLKPGGELRGVTPNVDAADARWLGGFWAGWHPPRHFVLFTPETLRRYAESGGWIWKHCSFELEGANHWSVSWHSMLARRQGWRASHDHYRMSMYPLLLPPALLLALGQKLFSRTSVMSFVLEKPRAE